MPVGSPGQMQSVIAKGGICDNYSFEALDIGRMGGYLSECTEHGAPKVEGSPARQSLRRRSIG
jgi:hypothetical protein